MFDDFCQSSTTRESHARFRRSMAAAVVIYVSSTAAIVAATATVRKIVEEKETRVEFAPPPEPEPPPPPPPPVAAAPLKNLRPKVKRPELAPPDKISDEKLKESNKALASADTGPVDGFLDGVEGGTGTGRAPPPPPPPPPPKLEPLTPASDPGGNDRPAYSSTARRKGIEGTVVVEFDVLEDGRIINPRIVSGPPEFHDTVLRAVRGWRYRPAHRGATVVRYHARKSIVFRLEDA
jgi:periplasmic protein TonB